MAFNIINLLFRGDFVLVYTFLNCPTEAGGEGVYGIFN